MSDFSLGSITDLPVSPPYDGFDRPNNAQLVTLLSDGSSSINQVLQQSALTLRQAKLHGRTRDPSMIATLKGWYDTRESLVFTDCDGLVLDVRIFDLTTDHASVGDRNYQMTLIEAGA